jgi:hypothetical protein
MTNQDFQLSNTKQKYEKQILTSAINLNKSDVTHTDFINFLEPFVDSVDEKKYNELLGPSCIKEPSITKEQYRLYNEQLRSILYNCYIFDDNVDLESTIFEKELHLSKNFSLKNDDIAFFEKNLILNNFKTTNLIDATHRYKEQVCINNRRRKKIQEIFSKRIKALAYFRAYNLIHKELESIYRKIRLRRKKKQCDIEDQMISEYLNRIDEFIEIFGPPDQFSNDEFQFNNVFEEESKELPFNDVMSYLE